MHGGGVHTEVVGVGEGEEEGGDVAVAEAIQEELLAVDPLDLLLLDDVLLVEDLDGVHHASLDVLGPLHLAKGSLAKNSVVPLKVVSVPLPNRWLCRSSRIFL